MHTHHDRHGKKQGHCHFEIHGSNLRQHHEDIRLSGVTIGAIGTLMGCIGGLAVALNLEKISVSIENLFGFKILPGDVYYLSQLPSQVNYSDVAIIVIGTC